MTGNGWREKIEAVRERGTHPLDHLKEQLTVRAPQIINADDRERFNVWQAETLAILAGSLAMIHQRTPG